MIIGYIGLGKMGANMVERLLEKGHAIFTYDPSPDAFEISGRLGAEPIGSIAELAAVMPGRRVFWLMVPNDAVDSVLAGLALHLSSGDTVIDGGNSRYKDSMRRAEELQAKGIHFLDAGVSGGPGGARNGACVMVGGEKSVFDEFEALFRDIAADDAYAHVGPNGAGHFVKMVHNGIEYGMMQALAEGFAILKSSPFNLDLKKAANLYNHKSVIESRLVGWLEDAYEHNGQDLNDISGSVVQTGEGLWTVEAAREFGVNAPIIEKSVEFRTVSSDNPSYAGKILSALRNEFGGHAVKSKT